MQYIGADFYVRERELRMAHRHVKGPFGAYLETEFIEAEEYLAPELRSCFHSFLEFLASDSECFCSLYFFFLLLSDAPSNQVLRMSTLSASRYTTNHKPCAGTLESPLSSPQEEINVTALLCSI